MKVLDEIMVNGQMWPHKDGVELHATKVTTWNEFCCFNATPWDETSFNEMSHIERGLWMNAWKQIKWIHEIKWPNKMELALLDTINSNGWNKI
jgi:hypothetical protein